MDIKYYKADLGDVEVLADLRIQFLVEFLGEQPEFHVKTLEEHLKDYFKKSLRDQTYICYIAIHNNIPVGVGGMVIRQQPGNFKNPSGRVGYFMNMYTLPEFRKQGISTAILQKLKHVAAARKITAFELHATKEGESLYRKNGFTIHTEPTYRQYMDYEEHLNYFRAEPDPSQLSIPLKELELSHRVLNVMENCDIFTLGDLVQFDRKDFLKFRNFGKRSLEELENLVLTRGLRFGIKVNGNR